MCNYVKIFGYERNPECGITGAPCLYFRRCTIKMTWIPNENIKYCPNRMKEDKVVPDGAYYVRFVKHGYAYVDIDGKVEKIKYEGSPTDYLFLEQKDGKYIIKE